jgi:hypothetical protein
MGIKILVPESPIPGLSLIYSVAELNRNCDHRVITSTYVYAFATQENPELAVQL